MTLDPRDIPFTHPAPLVDERVEPARELKAESILLEEFSYAGVSAYQAREDSGALANMYLIATGAFATGLGVMANVNVGPARPTISIIATTTLSIFALLSFGFFARFLGLEQEYREGLLAMGAIKEYYIQHLKRTAPDIELAFRWRLHKRPRAATLAGGAPIIAWTIALLGSLSVAGAVGEARLLNGLVRNTWVAFPSEPALGFHAPYVWEILCGLLAFAAHGAYYLLVARRRRTWAQHDASAQMERIEQQASAS